MGTTDKEYEELFERQRRSDERKKKEEGKPYISMKDRIKMRQEIREQLNNTEPKKRGRPKKNIMKGRADLIESRVVADLNIRNGLEPKVKRALRKAVIEDLDKKINMKGRSIKRIDLSDSDSD
jgi:hypothetical protein